MRVTHLKIAITVKAAPYSSGHWLALACCQEVIRQGHTISQIFFYQQAVTVASSFLIPDQNEINLTNEWQSLSKQAEVPLYVCVSASLKRGIINEDEARLNDIQFHNLAESFEIAGLGQWLTPLMENEKRLTFR